MAPHPEPHDTTAPPLTTDDILSFIRELRRQEDLVAAMDRL